MVTLTIPSVIVTKLSLSRKQGLVKKFARRFFQNYSGKSWWRPGKGQVEDSGFEPLTYCVQSSRSPN